MFKVNSLVEISSSRRIVHTIMIESGWCEVQYLPIRFSMPNSHPVV